MTFREIKFRAWDKCHKELITEIDDIDFLNKEIYWKQCFAHPFDDVELMQYTGLKDKNGKEIYEGDIIKNQSGSRMARIEAVEWDEFYTGFRPFVFADGDEIDNEISEIIGNIYENPELLKEGR